MARRRYKKKSRRSKAKSIPVAVMAPIAMMAVNPMKYAISGDVGKAFLELRKNVMGVEWDGSFNPGALVGTYTPIITGVVVHKLANKFGINSYVRRMTGGYLSL